MLNYASPEVLVDTQWLAEHLNDESVRIVEVNVNPQENNTQVISGAIIWNSFTDLMLPDYGINFDKANIEKLLSGSGITNDSTVIVYGELPAVGGWIFWLLKVFGHRDVKVLNGSRATWIAEKLPTSQVQPTFNSTPYRAKEPDANLRSLYEDVRNSIEQPDSVILDVNWVKFWEF